MVGHLLLVLSLSIALLVPSQVDAQTPAKNLPPASLLLVDDRVQYALGKHMRYIEDKEGLWTLEDVIAPAMDSSWKQVGQAVPSFGYTESVYWFSFQLESNVQSAPHWMFEITYPLIDKIDIFHINATGLWSHIAIGDSYPFGHRRILHRNFLVPFMLRHGDVAQYVLRVETQDTMQLPITLWHGREFFSHEQSLALVQGGLNGAALLLILLNLSTYWKLRDVSYLYYSASVVGILFAFMCLHGYAFQHIWPNSVAWQKIVIFIVSPVVWLSLVAFSVNFLKLRQHARYLYLALLVSAIPIAVSPVALIFTSRVIIGPIQNYLSMSMVLLLLLAGAWRWYQGMLEARYFTLAWCTFLAGGVLLLANRQAFIPRNIATEHSYEIGFLLTGVLLSLALADRISAERLAKEKAQTASIEASESSMRLKNNFLVAVSHELRTPMQGIFGGVDIIQHHSPPGIDEPLELIQSSASDMMGMVDDILCYTETLSGQLRCRAENTHFNELLEVLSRRCEGRCQEKGLAFILTVDPDLPQWLKVDGEKLVSILHQILDNAVKFTTSGDITLAVECDRQVTPWQLTIAVGDSGIGIEGTDREIVFESFRQLDNGIQRSFGGLGIGLAICYQLVEALNGTLEIEPQLNGGTSFVLSLPVEEGHPPSIINSAITVVDNSSPILIVDDNIVNQKVLQAMLHQLGYASLVAEHGQAALEVMGNEEISLVLMDLQMPVMDGFHCAQAIRENGYAGSGLPIIAVSANLMDADKDHCIEVGMNGYLRKPVQIDVLQETLSEYVQPPSQEESLAR